MKGLYNCPHCGEKSFNPWTKAMAGQLNSNGKVCPNCGRRAVNGKAATIFNAVFSVVCFIAIVLVFIFAPQNEWLNFWEVPVVFGLILLKLIVPRIVNAFFFPLEPAIKSTGV